MITKNKKYKKYKKNKNKLHRMQRISWLMEKTSLSKYRKMSLEFSKIMFNEMEEFVGK